MPAGYSHEVMYSLYTDQSFSHIGVPVIGYSKTQDLRLLCWMLDHFLLESGLLRFTLRIPHLGLLKPFRLVRLGKQNGSYTNLPKQK